METSKEYKLKDSFICDRCRNICKAGCHEKLLGIQNGTIKVGTKEYEDNKDLIGRKQIIHCLGKYCDKPCEFQRKEFTPYNESDGITSLVELIKWMGSYINNKN